MRTAYSIAALGGLCAVCVATAASASELHIGAGSSLTLGANRLDLGCADLDVAGSLSMTTGAIEAVRDVSGAGSLAAGAGTVRVGGDWLPATSFLTAQASVEFIDACGRTTATVLGDNSFGGLQLRTDTGKAWFFEAGRTQTITDWLDLRGNASAAAFIRSTSAGTAANFALLPSSFGVAQDVDADDIHATQGFVAVDPGSLLGPNIVGWISPSNVPVLPALAAALALFGVAALGVHQLGPRARAR